MAELLHLGFMFYFIHKYSGGFDMLFLSEQEIRQSPFAGGFLQGLRV